LNVPTNEEQYEKSISELDQLRDALTYWGKIIQRLSKIKFIRSCRKISAEVEYSEAAEKEEKFIEQEKAKYQGDSTNHDLNAEKLKIAQVIDRESRLNKMWKDDDEEEANYSDEEQEEKRAPKQAKAAKRPNREKFAEIMKKDDAFPTLVNDLNDDEFEAESDNEAPAN